MWVVGELEDERCVSVFARYSVSAAPESWILIKDNVMYCYWPKSNAIRKIKSAEHPVADDNNWSIYKCRLLMHGEKFSTYKDAKMAELICQNFSTISQYNENDELKADMRKEHIGTRSGLLKVTSSEDDKQAVNGFIVESEDDVQVVNGFTVESICDCISDNSSSHDDMRVINGFFVENLDEWSDDNQHDDTQIMNGCNFRSHGFIVEDIGKWSDYDAQSDDESLQNKHYQSQYDRSDSLEFNEDSILTSTRIDSKNAMQVDVDVIEQMQSMLSLFCSDFYHKLDQIKGGTLVQRERNWLDPLLEVSVANSESGEMNISVPTAEIQKSIVQDETIPIPESDVTFSVPEPEVLLDTISESVEAAKVRAATIPETENTEVIIPLAKVQVAIMQDDDGQDDEGQEVEVQRTKISEVSVPTKNYRDAASGIKLPFVKNDQYNNSNDLLKANGKIKDTLIEHLSGLKFNDRKQFLNGVITELFEHKYFMKNVSWKVEPGKVLLKDSEVLKCWMSSYFTKFKDVITSEDVHTICTNYKSRHRKADKAKEQKLQKK